MSPGHITRQARKEIIEAVDSAIGNIHATELASIAIDRLNKPSRDPISYPRLFIHIIWAYAVFFVQTWARTILNIFKHPFAPFDAISQIFWATVSTSLAFVFGVSSLIFRLPIISRAYKSWSDKNAGGLSVINAAKPKIFSSLNGEQIEAALRSMSEGFERSSEGSNSDRTFDLDISRLLLLCTSTMYERDALQLNKRINKLKEHIGTLKKSTPDFDLLSLISSTENFNALKKKLEEKFGPSTSVDGIINELQDSSDVQKIKDIAADFGLEFHIISELNSHGSASAGLFYSPDDHYIILAFGGTTDSDYDEWLKNCDFTTVDAGSAIPGFGGIRRGFFERIFPSAQSATSRHPYDSIKQSVTKVSTILEKYHGGVTFNIYFTGFSLGSAISTLAYARAVSEPKELGQYTEVRDGYLFGAPLMGDLRSINAFNANVYKDSSKRRTLWRVTQGHDIVTTTLPAGPDHPRFRFSPLNIFRLAHLGTEIIMKDPPEASLLDGHHLIRGSPVTLHSDLNSGGSSEGKTKSTPSSETEDKPNTLLKVLNILEWVPVVSGVVDHLPYKYNDQLARLVPGDAKWKEYGWFPSIPAIPSLPSLHWPWSKSEGTFQQRLVRSFFNTSFKLLVSAPRKTVFTTGSLLKSKVPFFGSSKK